MQYKLNYKTRVFMIAMETLNYISTYLIKFEDNFWKFIISAFLCNTKLNLRDDFGSFSCYMFINSVLADTK